MVRAFKSALKLRKHSHYHSMVRAHLPALPYFRIAWLGRFLHVLT